jgi:small subunit ribosomal protein S17
MAEQTQQTQVRGHRKERVGEVVSDKMTKTIVVRVERRFRHPQYKKVVTSYNKFYAHDEQEQAKVGDLVRIQETRPLSKLKNWRLMEILNADGSSKVQA